jgi:4,5-DOPA dioxygenase extradiol
MNASHPNIGRFEHTEKFPVLFLGHGSPINAIEENEFVDGWRKIGKNIPKPDAILCISAHWETAGTYVTAMENPPTIHDFGGFPQALYSVQYPAPGNPVLANRIKELVRNTEVSLDTSWGLDHGCWSVIKHLYPAADVPVIQMSLHRNQTPQYHYELGRELSSLRQKGVLIVGSGNMVHNLGRIAWERLNDDEYGYDWAIEANERMKKLILAGNHKELIGFRSLGRTFDLAIPTDEHFLPLIYILALIRENDKLSLFNDKLVGGSLSMTCLLVD